MSVIAKEILKQYITCENQQTNNKFYNLLDSFWHKAEGKIVKSLNKDEGVITSITLVGQDGKTETVAFPKLPNSQPISFIQGLAEALGKKVNSVPGKQLSEENFTTELLNKLKNLQNYQHPELHQISEIEGLVQALADLAPPEGFGFSELNFSPAYKDKIDNYPIGHYAAPVNDLAALAALPEADIPPYQRRPVKSEKVDYFYDLTAVEGDVAPNDQTDGSGFWIKGVNTSEVVDNLTSTETGKGLSANQGRILKNLYDGVTAILESDDTALDEFQEIVPYIKANRDIFENLSIENIAGLVDSLAAKLPKGSYEGTASDLLALINGKVSKTGNESIGGQKTFADTAKFDKTPEVRVGAVNNSVGYFTFGATDDKTIVFNTGNDRNWFTISSNQLTAPRAFYLPDKPGTFALLSDLESLRGGRPTKLIDNATQYTLKLEDKNYHLKIINPINLIAPSGVFADADEIQFKNYSDGDVTMVEGSGTRLEVVSSQQEVVPAKGFGGMRYESASKAGVFGQLKPI